MRALTILALLGGTAYANTRVVVMTGPDDAAAMQVALAGRGADVAVVPAPEGALRLDRAAVAQREAVAAQAIAGVWIEQEPGTAEVCVVSSDGHVFRHAPLADTSPRVFAAIATSLLDEVLAPPSEANINVDVNVTVGGASAAPAIYSGPSAMPAVAVASSELPIRSTRTLLELGPMLTPYSAGAEVGVMFPLADHWRAGGNVIANMLFDTAHATPVIGGTAELRHIGSGARHFDVGVGAGLASADNASPVKIITARFGWVWEGPQRGIGISISPVLVLTGDSMTPVVPAAYAALRWEVPM